MLYILIKVGRCYKSKRNQMIPAIILQHNLDTRTDNGTRLKIISQQ